MKLEAENKFWGPKKYTNEAKRLRASFFIIAKFTVEYRGSKEIIKILIVMYENNFQS